MPNSKEFLENLFDNLSYIYRHNLSRGLVEFLKFDYRIYNDDVNSLMIVLVQSVISYIILNQDESNYMKFFEQVTQMESLQADKVTEFLHLALAEVEKANPEVHSKKIISQRRLSLSKFEKKFAEYEEDIVRLKMNLNESRNETDKQKLRNQQLVSENRQLRNELQVLTTALSEATEKVTQKLGLEFKQREEELLKDLEKMQKRFDEQSFELRTHREKLLHIKEKKKKLKEENTSNRERLKSVKQNFVPKDEYERKVQEGLDLERKLMQLENSLIADTSETRSIQMRNQRLKSEKKQLADKFEKEVSELEMKLEETTSRLDEYERNSDNRSYTTSVNGRDKLKQPKLDWKAKSGIDNFATNLEGSDFSEGNMLKAEMNGKYESMLRQFEELKMLSSTENKQLRDKVLEMNSEMQKLKRENRAGSQLLQRSKSIVEQRSTVSDLRKNQEVSGELLNKICDLEKREKQVKIENKYLHESIIRNLAAYKSQLDVLYTVLGSYMKYSLNK